MRIDGIKGCFSGEMVACGGVNSYGTRYGSLHRSCGSARLNASTMVRHYLIKGRVQGVGFRWFVHREAESIGGLRGWVKNTDAGHVEIVAAGDATQLAELKAALHKGSRGSRVDAVVEHELAENEADALGPFQIEGAW